MVLAERNSEIMRNGRRSRGPSPNGHGGSPDSSSDEDSSVKKNGSKSKTKQSEYEEKIRVGRDYQATCPDLIPMTERKPELLNDRALLVWSPTKDIPDNKLEEYISVAKEKYGYNGEQALGMLFWHKHDLERAVMDLANFTPFPDEWTVEDKVLFEQAFQFHGKSFHRIRQMLPDKSIASLVKYYYSWKKTRHRQSVMDRQEKAKLKDGGSDNGSENGSNEESDNDEKEQSQAPSTSQDSQQKQQFGSISSGNIDASSKISKNQTNQIQSTIPSSTTVAATTKRQQQQQQQQQQQLNSNAQLIGGTNNINTGSSSSLFGGGLVTSSSIGTTTTTIQNQQTQSFTNAAMNNNHTAPLASSSSSSSSSNCCTGCGVSCNQINTTPQGNLCNSCYHHWRRTGTKRPTTGPYFGKRFRDRNAERHKRKPPRGMHINHDDIVAQAKSSNSQDELIANTESKIISLLSQVQQNKQHISSLKSKISESSEDLRPAEQNNRINSRWNNEELSLAVHGIKKFGKDYQAIAETIGTKTEAHVRTFFVNYRRRYNLDSILKEHEAEKEAQRQQQETSQETNNVDQQIQQFPQQQQQHQQQNKIISNDIEVIDISTSTPSNPSQQQQQQQPLQQQFQQQQQITQQFKQQILPQENIIMEIDLENEPSLESINCKNL